MSSIGSESSYETQTLSSGFIGDFIFRNKRMFGLLLGTLSKFQAESQVKKEKVRGWKTYVFILLL